mmetsp:Transcript_42552/g.126237  ORF Transcript_42552/g.126237 Transcript_42552/m.126237 type:complete len:238 (-) Transcript_42552:1087-1800(-)
MPRAHRPPDAGLRNHLPPPLPPALLRSRGVWLRRRGEDDVHHLPLLAPEDAAVHRGAEGHRRRHQCLHREQRRRRAVVSDRGGQAPGDRHYLRSAHHRLRAGGHQRAHSGERREGQAGLLPAQDNLHADAGPDQPARRRELGLHPAADGTDPVSGAARHEPGGAHRPHPRGARVPGLLPALPRPAPHLRPLLPLQLRPQHRPRRERVDPVPRALGDHGAGEARGYHGEPVRHGRHRP